MTKQEKAIELLKKAKVAWIGGVQTLIADYIDQALSLLKQPPCKTRTESLSLDLKKPPETDLGGFDLAKKFKPPCSPSAGEFVKKFRTQIKICRGSEDKRLSPHTIRLLRDSKQACDLLTAQAKTHQRMGRASQSLMSANEKLQSRINDRDKTIVERDEKIKQLEQIIIEAKKCVKITQERYDQKNKTISEQAEEIKQLKKLAWDCHWIILHNNEPKAAAELIVEKLNPEAIERRKP